MTRRITFAAVLVTISVPALAQQPSPRLVQPWPDSPTDNQNPRHIQPTMMTHIDQSLTDLLNSGWAIVSGVGGMGALGVFAQKSGKNVFCALDVGGSGSRPDKKPSSECMALN